MIGVYIIVINLVLVTNYYRSTRFCARFVGCLRYRSFNSKYSITQEQSRYFGSLSGNSIGSGEDTEGIDGLRVLYHTLEEGD